MPDSHQIPALRSTMSVPRQEADPAQGRAQSSGRGLTAMSKPEVGCHLRSGGALLWTDQAVLLPPAKVDAIIVPTVRAPGYLEDAATVATRLDCPLVTLHSGKSTRAEQAAQRFSKALDLIAIDVSDPKNLRLPDTMTSRMLQGTRFARRIDTSHKRNLGLVLSHMMRWERVVFLDDDIRVPDPDHLRQAVGLLDTYNAVGLALGGFPDNSVVCHAYRAVGGAHQSLIGGGALAIDVSRSRSFFPDIYNEDWFYLLDDEGGIQPTTVTGMAIQRPYDPFQSTSRVRSEGFGDVLATGVFSLLERGSSWADADERYWQEFITRRHEFIDLVLNDIVRAVIEPGEKARLVEIIRAARGRLALITPGMCHYYLRSWMADRIAWQRHIRRLPHRNENRGPLRWLSAKGKPPLTYYSAENQTVGLIASSRPFPNLPEETSNKLTSDPAETVCISVA
jgi:glycosyltransferase involved in cell wall biosynthesis